MLELFSGRIFIESGSICQIYTLDQNDHEPILHNHQIHFSSRNALFFDICLIFRSLSNRTLQGVRIYGDTAYTSEWSKMV